MRRKLELTLRDVTLISVNAEIQTKSIQHTFNYAAISTSQHSQPASTEAMLAEPD